jgi:hypothetical protein
MRRLLDLLQLETSVLKFEFFATMLLFFLAVANAQEAHSPKFTVKPLSLPASDIRKLGGALFCDRRYDKVFVYHNGAESYHAARAFRGSLRV